jgi:hypothetical protein
LTPAGCTISSERSRLVHLRKLGHADVGKAQLPAKAVQRIIGDEGGHDKRVGRGDMLGDGSIDLLPCSNERTSKSIERRIASDE